MDTELNQNDFAKLCGVHIETIRTWREEGLPCNKPTRNSAYFDIFVCIPWVKEHKWMPSLDDRERKLKAEADMAEMNRDEQAGVLVKGQDVTDHVTECFTRARVKLLALPARMAPQLATDQHPAKTIKAKMEAVIRETLEELAQFGDEANDG